MNEPRFAVTVGGRGLEMLSACSSAEVVTALTPVVFPFPGLKRYAVIGSFLRAG